MCSVLVCVELCCICVDLYAAFQANKVVYIFRGEAGGLRGQMSEHETVRHPTATDRLSSVTKDCSRLGAEVRLPGCQNTEKYDRKRCRGR